VNITSTKAIAMLLTAGAMVACVTTEPPGPIVREHHSYERGAATKVDVEIYMSAGELEMKSGAKTLFEGDFIFNVPALKPGMSYVVGAGEGTLTVHQGSANGNYENSWRLSLDETTPIDLEVRLAAGDAQLALGRVNLQGLKVRLGAGDLTLDLRGTPANSYSVNVEAGAGDTTIRLPASVGISARTTGLIGDSNVSGLEKRDGRWINPRAEASPVTIDVNVKHAIGDLRLVAE
jgi:hypothetical protein